jgi:hypothetical protein
MHAVPSALPLLSNWALHCGNGLGLYELYGRILAPVCGCVMGTRMQHLSDRMGAIADLALNRAEHETAIV